MGCSSTRFGSDRFRDLAAAGARVQKPLWASTSTKNPDYPDLIYVENLVAGTRSTPCLCPPSTPIRTTATRRRRSSAPTTSRPLAAIWIASGEVGVDYDDVVRVLEEEGVEKFTKSWHELLESVEQA